MPKESVLTIADKEAIEIEKLIFHIILKDDAKPHFLDELVITDEQKKFFKDRLSDSAQGRQYIFRELDVPIRKLTFDLLNASDNFIKISKEITNRFKITHTGNSNDGVFVISLAKIKKRKLLFMIKLDHKKVYEYKLKGSKALLEEVKNTFIEDKSAIQKVALIDISASVVWDVLVYDRSKPASITDYFAKFLDVLPRETETQLTENAVSHVRKWASENRAILDPSQEPSNYKNRAIEHLNNVDLFETDEFINAVIFDSDGKRRNELKTSLFSYLVNVGMAGQSFAPNKNALTPKCKNNIRQTEEGVRIEWEGNAQDKNIDIPNEPDSNDGNYHIAISTRQITVIQ
jgi:hypothetical protein